MLHIDVIDQATPAVMQKAFRNASSLPMDEIGRYLVDSVRQNFELEGRPVPWAPRKEPTGSWPLLDKTGRLKLSIDYMVLSGTEVRVDHNTDYGDYLDEGTSRMVARPFLMLQDEDLPEIENMMLQHILSI